MSQEYMKLFPTRWPLFEIFLNIWKLRIATALFTPSGMSDSYEYIRFEVTWGNSLLFHIRLWDATRRKEDRLKYLLSKGIDYTVEQLEEIRDLANKYIEEKKA